MEYLVYLETIWEYLPYLFYTFVFVTLIPKSFCKIKNFANANYEANRNKYHRCYGPDLCCHGAFADETLTSTLTQKQTKQRKAVTRVYPKRHSTADLSHFAREPILANKNYNHNNNSTNIKRQVPTNSIHTRTNVNQIAKMFENSTTSMEHKKINRVMPTILPEIRMFTEDDEHEKMIEIEFEDNEQQNNNRINKQQQQQQQQFNKKLNRLSPTILKENIENSVNLLNQVANDLHQQQQQQQQNVNSWHSIGGIDTSIPTVVKRRARATPPTQLHKAYAGGTSATPSTASPAASLSPLSSSTHSSPATSPVRRTAPPLILKSSLEDIFAAIAQNAEEQHENFLYAGCQTLSPVTSIDDILSQRRLSRPLSAYSISDLLNEENATIVGEKDEQTTYVENFLRTLNKT